jgi:hypothetical protein
MSLSEYDIAHAEETIGNSGYHTDSIISHPFVTISPAKIILNDGSEIEICPICHGSDIRETKDGKFCNQLCKKLIPAQIPWNGSTLGGLIYSSSAQWNELIQRQAPNGGNIQLPNDTYLTGETFHMPSNTQIVWGGGERIQVTNCTFIGDAEPVPQ